MAVRLIKRLPTGPIRAANRVLFKLASVGLPRLGEAQHLRFRSGAKVLVLAPHADDEMLGCGGAIMAALDQNCQVTVVYLTDGRKSYSELYSEAEIARMRRKEAERVGALVGVRRLIFLEHPNMGYTPDEAAITEMREILRQEEPEIAFVPFFLDVHPDHIAASQVFAEAANREGWAGRIMAYEIQVFMTTRIANRYVDSGRFMEVKRALMGEYRSQTMTFTGLLDLNELQAALVTRSARAVELFLEMTAPGYLQALQRFLAAGPRPLPRPVHDLYRLVPFYLSGTAARRRLVECLRASKMEERPHD